MQTAPLFIGQSPFHAQQKEVSGDFVVRAGESYYQIANYDQMRPFFMSIVSPTDHWLFIASNGALTAGRRNPEHALFPYYTDDKIYDSPELTGSKSIFLVEKGGRRYVWEPFSDRFQGAYQVQRNLYKHVFGNKIIFEEINEDLGVRFSYTWTTSNRFGFVKTAELSNEGGESVRIKLLDGVQNLLPYGVTLPMQTELSTLVDAYKKNELQAETGMGLYILSSILVDKPEPSEALKATTVWSKGLEAEKYLLSSIQLDRFRRGLSTEQETDVRAERGAYFIQTTVELTAGEKREWHIVAEIEQGPTDVVALTQTLRSNDSLVAELKEDIAIGAQALEQIVACSDGLQASSDRLSTTRHFANTLFNVMRGGLYVEQYQIEKQDFISFLQSWNAPIAEAHTGFLQFLPDTFSAQELFGLVEEQEDEQLLRLSYEYLPLTFSRRHGDPSRPWNFFSIETQREDGSRILNYQGNWRDIFQNWESLSISYPEFVESIIAKFVNASTADGYNPYRITRDGIDWETEDPHDPWAFIGYWGDHQLIYLLKLLELSRDHHPGKLDAFLNREMFAYASVPYRISSFADTLKDPHSTITYDYEWAKVLEERVAKTGADGKLLWASDGSVYRVTLTEKLLVTLLTKISNFIPEAGIWMNTQRPEWNDANNALVGFGVSTVTLCYLRRFLIFAQELFSDLETDSIPVSTEVVEFFNGISETLRSNLPLLEDRISDQDRFAILQGLGEAGSQYRLGIYDNGMKGEMPPLAVEDMLSFFEWALAFVDHSLQANKRADDLYHAYHLMEVKGDHAVEITPLYEMLEGQVAILSSGFLSASESVSLLKALKNSKLYRADQYSYLLYPDRTLARYEEKNQLPVARVEQIDLLNTLLQQGNRQLIEQDIAGGYHFNGTFRNGDSVKEALQELADAGYADTVAKDSQAILDLFEDVFNHKAFTGRSGTFYGYEGLGCIYWHMVSKLLLAVQETYYWAFEEGEEEEVLNRLVEAYYDVRAGIGLNKSPDVYGAFPTDPYSHTPGNNGAQQPGMTGQVKEDILSRFGELGIVVKEGKIHFQPILLRRSEFLSEPQTYSYYTVQGDRQSVEVSADSMGFTYCQVPVVYSLTEDPHVILYYQGGNQERIDGQVLSAEISSLVFGRSGEIEQMEVFLNPRIA